MKAERDQRERDKEKVIMFRELGRERESETREASAKVTVKWVLKYAETKVKEIEEREGRLGCITKEKPNKEIFYLRYAGFF